MKDFFKKVEFEKWLSAICGLVALVAIFYEMKIANFDAASIAGGIKDVAGTIIAVVMLIVALEIFRKKETKAEGFQEAFNIEIEKVITKYNPLFTFYGIESTQKVSDAYRYNIANKLDSISTKDPGGNHKFFRVKEGFKEVEFSVSATVFGDRKEAVAARISSRIKDAHNEFILDTVPSKEGFVVQLINPLQSQDDAVVLSDVVDHILMLYIAEYKK